MNKKILLGAGIIIVGAVAWWLISPLWRTVKLEEKLPVANTSNPAANVTTTTSLTNTTTPTQEPHISSRATLIAQAHEVAGEALLVKGDQADFLRFENLRTINGPDLRIYLATDIKAKDFVDLGPIRATEGNVNYTIPAGTDLNKYRYALIWCRAFGVLFSYAQLENGKI